METLVLNSNSKKDLELIREIALKFGVDARYVKETAEQRKERLYALAKKLDESIIPNDITMEEIVEECRVARKENYEKRKNHS